MGLVPLVSALPFQIVAGITTLSSLDYLGYGLPVPTPSWGEWDYSKDRLVLLTLGGFYKSPSFCCD